MGIHELLYVSPIDILYEHNTWAKCELNWIQFCNVVKGLLILYWISPKTVVIVKRTFMHVHIHVFDVVEMELDKWLQFEADI